MAQRGFVPAARFGFLNPVYDVGCRLLGLGPRFREFQERFLDGMQAARILEVGCGTGELTRLLARRFPAAEVTAVDVDTDILARAREKLAREDLRVSLREARAEALPFPYGSFDLLVSSLVVHHLKSHQKVAAFREWRRVLSPGGKLLLFDFGEPHSRIARLLTWPLRFPVLEEQGDNFRGRIPGMLADAGFEVEEVGIYGAVVCAWRGS